MRTKRLGNLDLHITPVGFGAWAVGGSGWEFAWGARSAGQAEGVMRAAELRLSNEEVAEIESEVGLAA